MVVCWWGLMGSGEQDFAVSRSRVRQVAWRTWGSVDKETQLQSSFWDYWQGIYAKHQELHSSNL